MIADPQDVRLLTDNEPPAIQGKQDGMQDGMQGAQGAQVKQDVQRPRRHRREPVYAWWGVFAALGVVSLLVGSWRLALLVLLLWCLYEFSLIPAVCGIATRRDFTCAEPVRGRLFACTPEHQAVKNDALWRLVRLRNPARRRQQFDPNRTTGMLLVSPQVRALLAPADRLVLLFAGLGTLLTIVGAVIGLF